ncbi:MAG: tRNA pseudouridine(55) synthase TruB [Gammaproteobacteria bacterium 39-13]|nr:tRNA pseudouridine(55) synthase TruB [Gammaproteobacteria bacterium]OJV91433.1 MAG: tRNA pseudouridine(55) synthase TruB [Gammaproteobacteria bacterium 39-13]
MSSRLRECVDGILLLDKPIGRSSNAALQKAKYLLNAQKAGHTGSLDPLASGMLPLCFGEATKFSRFLLDERKTYQTVMRLGITTTTGDEEGVVLERKAVPAITSEKLLEMLAHFQGAQQQIPPMYSAVKFQGQPLYKLARQGKEIERNTRDITIYRLTLDHIDESDGVLISLTVECSKGTYIRTLVEDMGAYLGCGAHVAELRRLSVWPFEANSMITIEALEEMSLEVRKSHLLSMGSVLPILLPEVLLDESAAFYIRKGQIVQSEAQIVAGWVTLVGANGEFLGVGEMLGDGRIAPRRLIQQKVIGMCGELA